MIQKYQGDRGHNSAVGSRRSKANQSWELVEIGIDRGNTNWSLKQESVEELRTSIRNIHLEQYSEIIIWKSNQKQSSGKVILNRHPKH